MTTFEHRLMLLLAHGEQSAAELYALADDSSRVRRSLRLMISRGWAQISDRRKRSDGPGAPMNFYTLTEMGVIILHNHEEELREIRG